MNSSPGEIEAGLREAHSKILRSRIKLSPISSVRASSIGNECDRLLYYEQAAFEQRATYGESLQALFDLGNEMERYVVRMLEDMGYVVENRNHAFADRQHNITGHLDGRIRGKDWPATIPLEIKGLNPYTSDTIRTIDDIRNSQQAWVRKYYSQLQIYIHMGDDPVGLFVLLNKSTGLPTFLECPRDQTHINELLRRASLVKEAVLANEPPPRKRSDACQRCPFVHVCLPDIDFGQGAVVLDAPELIEAIRRREAAREARAEFEAADKIIKSMLPTEPGYLLVGPYELTGTRVERNGFTVKPGSYVKWALKVIGEAPGGPPLLDPFSGPRYLERVSPVPATAPAVAEGSEFD